MQLAPFQPYGNAFILVTNSVASTTTSVLVSGLLNIPAGQNPTAVRFLNKGLSDIWLSFTTGASALLVPTAGTTTIGTPQPVFWLAPGVDCVLMPPLPGGLNVFLNSISTGTSQTFYGQFGEGQ
jgi:hypothetical protein